MRLHFDLAVTQRLLDHSVAAIERSPTCDQLYEGRFRRNGKNADLESISASTFPTADDVDPTKIPAGLWLVGDHGIYLMSNSRPPLRPEIGDNLNIVAHAPEADPRINPEGWWEAKRAAFGGDDGVVFLELPFVEELIVRGREGRVCLDLTPAQVEAVVPAVFVPPMLPTCRRVPSRRSGERDVAHPLGTPTQSLPLSPIMQSLLTEALGAWSEQLDGTSKTSASQAPISSVGSQIGDCASARSYRPTHRPDRFLL